MVVDVNPNETTQEASTMGTCDDSDCEIRKISEINTPPEVPRNEAKSNLNKKSNKKILANSPVLNTKSTKNFNKRRTSKIYHSGDDVQVASVATSLATTEATPNANAASTSTAAASKGNQANSPRTTSPVITKTANVAVCLTSASSNKHTYKIPSDILDDLSSRFIINVPEMELRDTIRICFQIELTHWFYLDFYCTATNQANLQPCSIRTLALQLFEHIPFLNCHASHVDEILDAWRNYKLAVPTYGAILLSEDGQQCLLVQPYFAKKSWGFPKGKVNQSEESVHCAIREVYEETGFDISESIMPDAFIDAVISDQFTRLYIVRNVPLHTKFAPRTRKEIKCCDWFPIDELPTSRRDATAKAKPGLNSNSFYMVVPFMKRLKRWLNENMPVGGGHSQWHDENNVRKNKHQRYPISAIEMNASNNPGNNGTRPSGRQRHNSMGDWDGFKQSNSFYGHQSNTTMNTPVNGGNNQKRNSKANGCGGSIGPDTTPRRQLFHSQSHSGAQKQQQQRQQSEADSAKYFDDIRREKQQQINTEKTRKPDRKFFASKRNEEPDANGRLQAKTHEDKLSMLANRPTERAQGNSNQQANSQSQQQQQKLHTIYNKSDISKPNLLNLLAISSTVYAPIAPPPSMLPTPFDLCSNSASTPSTANAASVSLQRFDSPTANTSIRTSRSYELIQQKEKQEQNKAVPKGESEGEGSDAPNDHAQMSLLTQRNDKPSGSEQVKRLRYDSGAKTKLVENFVSIPGSSGLEIFAEEPNTAADADVAARTHRDDVKSAIEFKPVLSAWTDFKFNDIISNIFC